MKNDWSLNIGTQTCATCYQPIWAISPREYVDIRNNKASQEPRWHEHNPFTKTEGPRTEETGDFKS